MIQAVLQDQTDTHAELLHERQWLAHPDEADLKLQGNAFAVEDTLDGGGVAFLKLAPLPHARAQKSEWDALLSQGQTLHLFDGDGYPWARAPYRGRPENQKWNRIAAVQALQRAMRPFETGRDGLLVLNTAGDNGRGSSPSHDFMVREIEAAARLGADVVQIGDGWQQGATVDSAGIGNAGAGGNGVRDGFWAADPGFWNLSRRRFPHGLSPLVTSARAKGMKFGLWFAPDTSNDGARWQRDALAVLKMHQEEGVEYFVIDALKISSRQSEAALKAFLDLVRLASRGRVCFDLDITSEKRLGYLGAVEAGAVFVQNRSTGRRSYWPHLTLRALWQLAHWIDPLRLRLQWLDNTRHADKYGDDPLAPSRWEPDALFATVMMASPLAWLDAQSLPEKYFERAAPLISRWKEERSAMIRGTILPIGQPPDGAAWTGFASISPARDAAHVLVFRELNRSDSWQVEVPLLARRDGAAEVLGGSGQARFENGVLRVEGVERLGFAWVKV